MTPESFDCDTGLRRHNEHFRAAAIRKSRTSTPAPPGGPDAFPLTDPTAAERAKSG
ncbi:hypothetical protein ACWIGW_07290 [Nocardia brasiliensis]